jgi:hypothetical protein
MGTALRHPCIIMLSAKFRPQKEKLLQNGARATRVKVKKIVTAGRVVICRVLRKEQASDPTYFVNPSCYITSNFSHPDPQGAFLFTKQQVISAL